MSKTTSVAFTQAELKLIFSLVHDKQTTGEFVGNRRQYMERIESVKNKIINSIEVECEPSSS